MSRVLIGVLQPGARSVGIGLMGARRGVAMFDGVPKAVINRCFGCAAYVDLLANGPPQALTAETRTLA